jgi:TRAP-type C4-dicarboxylate transport system substrate-binding protein
MIGERNEMKRTTILFSILCVLSLITCLTASCTTNKPKEEIILRVAVAQPAADPITQIIEESAKKFNERTNGQYTMNIYPSETLVKMTESLDAVRTGAIEMMAATPWPAYAGVDIRLGELIYVFDDFDANVAAAQDPEFVEIHNDIFVNNFNQIVLSAFPTGIPQVVSRKPVKQLEDWDGLLIAVPAPVAADFVTLLGGAPITVPWTEYYAALEKGVADAVMCGTNQAVDQKLTDVSSYVTICNPYSVFGGYNVNLDVWNALPNNIQKILEEESLASAVAIDEYYSDFFRNDVDKLTALGIDVTVLSGAEHERWKAKTTEYVNEQLSGLGEFGERIVEVADRANAAN